jgi:Rieske Fe-S protein
MSKFNSMRRTLLVGTTSSILLAQFPFTALAQGPTAVCSRVGQKILFKGKHYDCQKVKGKLAWQALNPLKPKVQIHPASKSPTPVSTSTPSQVSGYLVAKISDLTQGQVKIVVAKDLKGASIGVALFLSGGVVTAHSAICTHQGCTVGEIGKNLACPCHGSVFNGQSGEVIMGPAQRPLDMYKVAEVNGEIYIVS